MISHNFLRKGDKTMGVKRRDIIKEVKEERFKNNCFLAVTYFINESKKIVVCKLEPYASSFSGFIDEPFTDFVEEKCSIDVISTRQFFINCCINDISTIGKAVCIEPDEFDVEFGKKIAYDKAMFKLLDLKNRHYKNYIAKLEGYIEQMNHCIENTNKQINKVTERYTKKLKEVAQ